MSDVVELFRQARARGFLAARAAQRADQRLLDLAARCSAPSTPAGPARRADRASGRAHAGRGAAPLVMPAVNVTRSLTKVFKTPHCARLARRRVRARCVDVGWPRCAAPAYFPAVPIGDSLYADGGMFAVAPDQVALHEAEHFMGSSADRVRMLSVGTATASYQPAGGVDRRRRRGLAVRRPPDPDADLRAAAARAGDDGRPPRRPLRAPRCALAARAGLGVDVATDEAAATLLELAEQTVTQASSVKLRAFLQPTS